MGLQSLGGTSGRKAWLVAGAASLVIFGAIAGFVALRTLTGDNTAATAATADTIKAVGKLYILPADEQPTVARIANRSELADQAFFDQARNGDILLVYKRSKLALLYRPDINKLVNAGPVTFPNDDGRTAGTQ